MVTRISDDFRDAQMGNPTHSVVDFDTDTVAAALLDQTDSGDITAAIVDFDEVDAPTIVAGGIGAGAIGSKTVGVSGTGAFDGADLTFSSVSGDAADFLTIFKDSGSAATSPLTVTFDSATTGLPVTPNGGDITVTWAAGGIIQI